MYESRKTQTFPDHCIIFILRKSYKTEIRKTIVLRQDWNLRTNTGVQVECLKLALVEISSEIPYTQNLYFWAITDQNVTFKTKIKCFRSKWEKLLSSSLLYLASRRLWLSIILLLTELKFWNVAFGVLVWWSYLSCGWFINCAKMLACKTAYLAFPGTRCTPSAHSSSN